MSDVGVLRDREGNPGFEAFQLDPAALHLNHGSYGATPAETRIFQTRLNEEIAKNTLRWFDGLPFRMAQARQELSEFLGAPEDEIAAVQNASAAASSIFNSLNLRSGEEIVLTDHIYGAVRMGVERLARRCGAKIVTVPVPLLSGAEEVVERVIGAVGDRTRLVLVDHISSATARRFPVERISAELAGSERVVLLVDGAHAPGLLPSPALREPHVVWFGNLHKYACAPSAAAVLVSQQPLADKWYPVIDSWGALDAFPERFDQQGSTNSTAFLSAPHAISTMESLFGWDRVREFSSALGSRIRDQILRHVRDDLYHLYDRTDSVLPVDRFIDSELPGGVSALPLFPLPRGVAATPDSARELKFFLRKKLGAEVGVSTWNGLGLIRFSPHAYNSWSEYEKFLGQLTETLART